MLTVFRSNRAEWLARVLSEQLRISPPQLTETVEIVVNTWPTSRWLGEEIAITNGINAQIKFPFPGSYIRELVCKVLDEEVDETDPWKARHLIWSIVDKLPELLNSKDAVSLKNWVDRYPCNTGELTREHWQLARSIADVFDDYILYRPELVNQWCNTTNKPTTSDKYFPNQAKWQPILFQLLKDHIDSEPLSIQVNKAIQKLQSKCRSSKNLPEKIRLFGITRLAPLQLEFIQAISGVIDVDVYLLTPCQDLWHRCRKRRENLGKQWAKPLDGNWLLNSPRLEATLGRMGAEFQQLLEGSGEYQLGTWKEEDLFALPVQIAKNQSKEPTLLEQLQEKLITQKGSDQLYRNSTDDSLIFVECPGTRRQVQIIRDQILQWMSKDKTLEPRDILIMTPQIEKFSPLISSIFNDIATTKIDIPWRITDRTQQNKPGLIQYILQLIDTAGNRFTATSLDLLLSNPSIQKQQDFDQEEINNISNCLQLTGFRWGLDSKEREGSNEHSLNWCLDRWLLGLIMPSSTGLALGGMAPFSRGVTPKDILKWWNLLTNLSNQIEEIRRPKSCIKWINLLQKILEDSFGDGGDWSWERSYFLSELEEWRKIASKYELKLNSSIVKDILSEALSSQTGRFGHRSGRLTISALEPMRAIPHKVIILMGLDENIFPRQNERPSFNLLDQTYQLGDPKSSDQDRYVLLEALMSTRQHLMITWNSRNERTGESLETANPINQWIEYLQNELVENEFNGLLTRPPANPLDRKNFLSTKARPSISCDARNLEARLWIDKSEKLNPIVLGIPLSWSDCRSKTYSKIDLETLRKWLIAPQLLWLKEYQLNPSEINQPISDIETLSLNSLERHTLIKTRLEEFIINEFNEESQSKLNTSSSFWEKITEGQGILPPNSAGKIETDLLERRWNSLIATIRKIGSIKKHLLEVESGLQEFLWAGEFHIIIEIGKIKNKTIMEAWLKHILMCMNGKKSNGTIIIARKSNLDFEHSIKLDPLPPKKAKEILRDLQIMANQGLKKCWPVPPESGWLLAKSKYHTPEKANDIFTKNWVGGFKIKGEREKAEMQLCFGKNCEASVFLENKSFHQALTSLYQPILKALAK